MHLPRYGRARGYSSLGIGWFFAIILVPGVFAIIVVLLVAYKDQRENLEGSALQASRALVQAVDREFAGAKGALLALATSPALGTGDLRSFDRQARELVARDPHILAIVLMTEDGQQIINTLRPFGTRLPISGHPEMVRQTFRTGMPTVSDLFVGAVANRYVVSAQVPVFRDDRVVYALNLTFLAGHFDQILRAQQVPHGWVAAILDTRGTVVARSKGEAEFVGKPATPDVLEKIRLTSEGSLASHTLEGIPSYAAFSRSSLTGWTVVIGMARSILYESLYRLFFIGALVMGVFVAAGALVSWLSTKYFRKSLWALESAIAEAASGNLGMTVPTTGPREIARLAERFNAMLIARKRAEAEVEHLAFFDPLTNLPNRRLLLDRINTSVTHADRIQALVAICYIDLDGFKPINDTFGHDAGDAALVEVADRLRGQTRAEDSLARLGGDEFVLVLAGINSESECAAILQRVLDALRRPIALEGSQRAEISASIGVALYPNDSRDPDILLRLSDQAMYRAKQAGRNRVNFVASDQEPSAETA